MPRKKRRGRNRRPKATTKEVPKAASSTAKPPAPPTPPASGSSPAQHASAPAAATHDADIQAIHERTAALTKQHSAPSKAKLDADAPKPSASDPVPSADKESKGAHSAAMQAIAERTAALASQHSASTAKQAASPPEQSAAKPGPSADEKEKPGSKQEAAEAQKGTSGLTDEQHKAAREKFDELDEDDSGTLKGPEMHKLADWLTSTLGRGNMSVDDHNRRKDRYGRELMKKLDADGDGELSFNEFVGWYAETSEQIKEAQETEVLTEQFDLEIQEEASETESKSKDVGSAKPDPYAAVTEFWEVHQKKHSELVEQGQKNLKTLKAKIEARTIARIQLLQKESEDVLGAARDHLARVQKTKAGGDGSEILDNAEKFYSSQITEVAELLEKLGAKIARIERGEWLRGMEKTAATGLSEEDKYPSLELET